MIERPEYIRQLADLKDKNIIKVITGIRRCGKSTLLDLYEAYLLKVGVSQKQIIRINFEETEDEAYQNLTDHTAFRLYFFIIPCAPKSFHSPAPSRCRIAVRSSAHNAGSVSTEVIRTGA